MTYKLKLQNFYFNDFFYDTIVKIYKRLFILFVPLKN